MSAVMFGTCARLAFTSAAPQTLTGKLTGALDGDTIEVNGTPIRLAALDCPERGTRDGDYVANSLNSFRAYRRPVSLQRPKHTIDWSDTAA
jgi:endonuclease YncB( thermonuclease family)